MFNKGDIAYFVFRGDWATKSYKRHYCLCLSYFPFMPVTIICSSSSNAYGEIYHTELFHGGSWSILPGCLEKEFSFDKFIVAQLDWGKRVSVSQFQHILATLGR